MRLKSLYVINDLEYSEGKFSSNLSFNPNHEVFKGHFPGQPIVPGVVLIHSLKNICSTINGSDVKLVKGTNIKFLNIVNPEITARISVSGTYIETADKMISLNASIQNKDEVNIKFKGIFSPVHLTM